MVSVGGMGEWVVCVCVGGLCGVSGVDWVGWMDGRTMHVRTNTRKGGEDNRSTTQSTTQCIAQRIIPTNQPASQPIISNRSFDPS